MKSGTTYLQNIMKSQLTNLAAVDWLYPMKFAPKNGALNHERAIYGLVGSNIPWVSPKEQAKMDHWWHKLSEEISDTDKNVIISAEAVAVMLDAGIELLVKSLPKCEIKVVITARDLGRVLPSSWQQSVRNGRTYTYTEYFDRIKLAFETQGSDPVGSSFWQSYKIAELVERWSKYVPIANITVVTVPRKSNPEELWQRFINALGISSLVEQHPTTLNDKQAHISITWPEAEALVQLNQAWFDQKIKVRESNRLRNNIIRTGFQHNQNRGPQIGLTEPWFSLAKTWAELDAENLKKTGVNIIGDLNDLLVDAQLSSVTSCSSSEIVAALELAKQIGSKPKRSLWTRFRSA